MIELEKVKDLRVGETVQDLVTHAFCDVLSSYSDRIGLPIVVISHPDLGTLFRFPWQLS